MNPEIVERLLRKDLENGLAVAVAVGEIVAGTVEVVEYDEVTEVAKVSMTIQPVVALGYIVLDLTF